jgi:hypothetical protein
MCLGIDVCPVVTSDKVVYVNQARLDRTGLTLRPINGRFRCVHNSDVLTPTTLHGKGGVNFLQDSATLLMKTQPVASAGQELSGHEGV